MDSRTQLRQMRRLWIPLLISVPLVLLDVLLLPPGPGLLICVSLAVSGFLLALAFFARKDARAAITFSGACVYAIAVALEIGILRQQEDVGKLRSAVLVVALESYRQEKGRWPESLDQLVSRYLIAVPAVSPRPGHRFSYRADTRGVLLSWPSLIPGSTWRYDVFTGEHGQSRPFANGLLAALKPYPLRNHAPRNTD